MHRKTSRQSSAKRVKLRQNASIWIITKQQHRKHKCASTLANEELAKNSKQPKKKKVPT